VTSRGKEREGEGCYASKNGSGILGINPAGETALWGYRRDATPSECAPLARRTNPITSVAPDRRPVSTHPCRA